MRKEDFARPKIPMPHTDCPKCNAPMYLVRITSDRLDHDTRRLSAPSAITRPQRVSN
jgi:hypothetical protein